MVEKENDALHAARRTLIEAVDRVFMSSPAKPYDVGVIEGILCVMGRC